MSRIGNRVIEIPSGVSLDVKKDIVAIKGQLGSLEVNYPKNINIKVEDNKLFVTRNNNEKQTKMYHGTVNANISNAITGVSKSFMKELVLKGVGYKAKLMGDKLNLSLGFSHPLNLEIPQGIKVETPKATEIKISGIDKAQVGQFAAVIRAYRKPEPYKGKGVLYKGEQIIRKAGKTAEGSKKK